MRLILSSILFYLLLSGNSWAQQLPKFDVFFQEKKVEKKSSEHFQVSWVNPRDAAIADALLFHLELARKKLEPSFSEAMKASSQKAPVEIYPDLESFSQVSGLSLARFRSTGTIALTLDQRLMVLSPINLVTGYSWAETVVHEYIHYLIREISPRSIPIWLHEGVAQIFQEYPYHVDAQLKPSQWGLFKKRRAAKQLLDLKTLREPFPYRKTPEEAELAYIQALLFSKWLDKKCGVLVLIKSMRDTASEEKGLESCTGQNFQKLESEFLSKIMAEVEVPSGSDVEFYARDFSQDDPLEAEGKKADKNSRDLALLSTKIMDQGRYRAAALEMKRALQMTPVSPPSWRRHLAIALQKANRDSEARQVLQELVESYPSDAGAWFLLGQLDLKQNSYEKSYQAFLRAFYQNPFLEGLSDSMEAIYQRKPEFKNRFLLQDY